MKLEEIYVLEWSKKQNAFHRHLLSSCIETNLSNFHGGISNDYIPIMAGTHSECRKAANDLRHKLNTEQPTSTRELSRSARRQEGKL